ncbi:hypothetical protein O1M63_39370 [Streptomyces mirabilis]|nr:hypothetical protein [Streptomyces mirabilis]
MALIASLGSFLTASKATMTQRAVRSVAVDWQVEVQPGADPAAALSLVRKTPGIKTALPVGFAHSGAFVATVRGSTQTTGPGMVLGLPDGYQQAFPGEIRPLTGRTTGVLLAQQTASNLHVAPATPSASASPAPRCARSGWTAWSTSRRPTPSSSGSAPPARPSPPRPGQRRPAPLRRLRLPHRARPATTQIHAARDAKLPPIPPPPSPP